MKEIQPQELRLGNIVYNLLLDRQDIVYSVTSKPGHCPSINGQDVDDYAAIPLTEQILIGLGAERLQNSEWQYAVRCSALKIYFRHNVEWYSSIENIYMGAAIQHVHKLQNVVHSLTGHELSFTKELEK